MKLLIDTNVVLDVVLAREPWAAEAVRLLAAVERGEAEGYVAAHAVTTVHYIVAKQRDREKGRQAVSDLLDLLTVAPATDAVFRRALTLPLSDFEDAVQAACALTVGVDCIVTRNADDFDGLEMAVEPAGAALARLDAEGPPSGTAEPETGGGEHTGR